MTGPSSQPRRDRPPWHVASIDPARPAEITLPLSVGQCARCATGNEHDHVWSEVDREVFGRVTLRRSVSVSVSVCVCVCDLCGRCDAWIVFVDVARG